MQTNKPPTIIAAGEILWDLFPSGPRFGGAPANFAHHAAGLGGDVSMVSAVGDDQLGQEALVKLRESCIRIDHVTINQTRPTGRVTVELDDQGHPTYRFNVDEAWDSLRWTPSLGDLAESADVVCFGTLSQRSAESRETIRSLVTSTQPRALRLLDLNLRSPYYDDGVIEDSLRIANVLKVNDEELDLIAAKFLSNRGDELARAKEIREAFNLKLVAVTRGERGSLLVREGEVSDVPAQPTPVNDTVGAGDSYTAAVTMGLLRNLGLDEINHAACRIAEYVCSQSGATPTIPKSLTDSLNR